MRPATTSHKIVDKVAAEIHPRDTFILFAAAHGMSENGRFYLIPQDYQSGPGNLARRAIGQDRPAGLARQPHQGQEGASSCSTPASRARWSPAMRARASTRRPPRRPSAGCTRRPAAPCSRPLPPGQDAHEGVIGASGERHGVFTWAVLDALRKGDTNGNGLIELSELVGHVQSVVPKIAAEMGNKQVARFESERRTCRGAAATVAGAPPRPRRRQLWIMCGRRLAVKHYLAWRRLRSGVR